MDVPWISMNLVDVQNPQWQLEIELPEIPRVGEYVEEGRKYWKVVGVVHRANVPGRVPVLYVVPEPAGVNALLCRSAQA